MNYVDNIELKLNTNSYEIDKVNFRSTFYKKLERTI